MTEEIKAQLEDRIAKAAREHGLAVESLTEAQFASAMRQALESGDFIRLVRSTDRAQQVVYIPYAEVEHLKSKFNAVTETISRYLIASKGHVADSWLEAFIECGAVTIDTTYPTTYIAPVKL